LISMQENEKLLFMLIKFLSLNELFSIDLVVADFKSFLTLLKLLGLDDVN